MMATLSLRKHGWTILAASLGLAAGAPVSAKEPAEPVVRLWRLDCGMMPAIPLAAFSDTYAYGDETIDMPVSCYLIQHGDRYMIWDTGFGREYIDGQPEGLFKVELRRSITDQLAELNIAPAQISVVGISHNHGDHVGQAADFPQARLLIGAAHLAAMRAGTASGGVDPAKLGPWLAPDSNAEGVTGDKDVFGDGRVVMLSMPGHTEGHHALLVMLGKTGPVLLSGDQYHFRAQVENRGVPPFNWNRAETLAAHDRFETLARNLGATVIIQHDPDDVGKLPVTPQFAE